MTTIDTNSGDLIDKASHLVNEAGQSIAAKNIQGGSKNIQR